MYRYDKDLPHVEPYPDVFQLLAVVLVNSTTQRCTEPDVGLAFRYTEPESNQCVSRKQLLDITCPTHFKTFDFQPRCVRRQT